MSWPLHPSIGGWVDLRACLDTLRDEKKQFSLLGNKMHIYVFKLQMKTPTSMQVKVIVFKRLCNGGE
jgi:hypothetical protein